MRLREKSIAGLVRSQDHIDRILQSQGFIYRSGMYDIRMMDDLSGNVYHLRIPAFPLHSGDIAGLPFFRLGKPSIHCNKGLSRFQSQTADIPATVIDAANHKLAEVVSYLRSNPT